jgi:hypothetical protein
MSDTFGIYKTSPAALRNDGGMGGQGTLTVDNIVAPAATITKVTTTQVAHAAPDTPPTIAAGPGLGTGGSASLLSGYSSGDMTGAIRLSTAGDAAGSGAVGTLTFATPRTTEPVAQCTPLSTSTTGLTGKIRTVAVGSAGNWTGFSIYFDATLSTTTNYDLTYQVL